MKENSLFGSLLEEPQKPSGPVTCLGMTFENDEARRAYFTEELRKKLQDPEFRKIEGFPIGSDEDILNLSDPPYYTACPNPWISDFIAEWETQKPYQPADYRYHREPFAADVSEGKNDPIYNAHSYHTKVPHKAIMRYILHYTQPGDIVFDGFCGTGMTGVAAQMCSDRDEVISLGYQVRQDGTILQEESDEDGKMIWKPFSKLGIRKTILNELSPSASFIAYNYNNPVNVEVFEYEANRIIDEVKNKFDWMYKTTHIDGRIGKINCVIWSDVFSCPECFNEVVFWKEAVDSEAGCAKDVFKCPTCSAELSKRNIDKIWETTFDSLLGKTVKRAKQIPVLILYTVSGLPGRFSKAPDVDDIELIKRIDSMKIDESIPNYPLPDGSNTQQPRMSHGFSHLHHFYTKRSLLILSEIYKKIKSATILFILTGILNRSTLMNRIHLKYYFFGGGGWNAGYLKGTLYVSSIPIESSVFEQWEDRKKAIIKSVRKRNFIFQSVTSCQSTTSISIPDDALDYLFFDPPFGANINYSQLNSIWEGWLKVATNIKMEAIENNVQKKGPVEYRNLMLLCFKEAYRVLKPGRWMTVEFSNTKASVWNSIQTALTEAGFIVANVSALDKKQGSFKAVNTPTAVKQDLVISAYKPNNGFEERFQKEAQTEEGVWDFVRTHLKYLPVIKIQKALLQFIPERDPRILFDQMVAYYVRKGYSVPISSQDFQLGLAQRFHERDGMYFLPDQVAEYDRRKMRGGSQQDLFLLISVFDEASAIQWLRMRLKSKPQQYNEIQPDFMPLLSHLNSNEKDLLSLDLLLNQNFLCYDGKGLVPEQIHSYLSTNWKELRNLSKDDPALVTKARDRWYVPDPNKAGDLEKLREKALLKEFEEYKEVKKKLKVFRLEAVRAGFKKAWQERDYAVIVAVADKIPNNVLEEDPKLLMWYDQAVTRMGGE